VEEVEATERPEDQHFSLSLFTSWRSRSDADGVSKPKTVTQRGGAAGWMGGQAEGGENLRSGVWQETPTLHQPAAWRWGAAVGCIT